MNAAVGLIDGLGLDGDRCIRVIPRQYQLTSATDWNKMLADLHSYIVKFWTCHPPGPIFVIFMQFVPLSD